MGGTQEPGRDHSSWGLAVGSGGPATTATERHALSPCFALRDASSLETLAAPTALGSEAMGGAAGSPQVGCF